VVASSAAHERAVRAAADAASAAFVAYGAWLRAQGDPRGEIVAADADAAPAGGVVASGCHACDANAAWFRRAAGPRARPDRPPWWPRAEALLALDPRSARAARHRALLERYGRHVLGRAAEGGWLRLGWRLGFVEIVHLAHPGRGEAAPCVALRRALRLPAARFARVVDVDLGGDAFDRRAPLAAAFGDGLVAPSVVSLSVGAWPAREDDDPDFDDAGRDVALRRRSAPAVGDLGPIERALPRLEHLAVGGRDVGLEGVDLGRLRHAAFDLACPDEPALARVARADWRRLRSLRLSLGDVLRPEHASDVAAHVVALVEGRRAPALRHLRLERVPLTDELCDAIGRSAAAERLVSLEIVRGEMTAEGAEALLRHRHRFRRLEALVVARNALPDEALDVLAARFGRRVELLAGAQRDHDPYDDGADSEFVREEELRARGGRPDPLGGPARDDDDGDDIEGLLDAAVVLSSLKEAAERDDEVDDPDDDQQDDDEAGAAAARGDGDGDGDGAWHLDDETDAPLDGDVDEEGEVITHSRRRRKRERITSRPAPRTAAGR
jgi:hypothetical protein